MYAGLSDNSTTSATISGATVSELLFLLLSVCCRTEPDLNTDFACAYSVFKFGFSALLARYLFEVLLPQT